MKNKAGILVSVAFLVLWGCASSKEEPVKETAVSSVDEPAIRKAITDAFKLEQDLAKSNPASRDAVLALFRKGFHEDLARRLTNYYWIEDASGGMIRATEPLFMVSGSILVRQKTSSRVVAHIKYDRNESGPNTWPSHILQIVLEKEGSVWKILSIEPVAAGSDASAQ